MSNTRFAIMMYFVWSLFFPMISWANHGFRGNRLRRTGQLFGLYLFWPIYLVSFLAQQLAKYLSTDFIPELKELLPKRTERPTLRSPSDLGLWE